MTATSQYFRVSPLWLAFACAVIALFSFASAACAAQCVTITCSEVAGHSQPSDNDSSDMMMGGNCHICTSVAPQSVAIALAPTPAAPDYFSALPHLAAGYVSPDVPPPRLAKLTII